MLLNTFIRMIVLRIRRIEVVRRSQASIFKPGVHRLVASTCLVPINKFCLLCLCLYMYLPQRLLITSGMICTSYDWLNKFYIFCMATVVGIVST